MMARNSTFTGGSLQLPMAQTMDMKDLDLMELESRIDLKVLNHLNRDDNDRKQKRFRRTVFAVQDIVNKKKYKDKSVSLEAYFKDFWKISRAQVYRFLDCATVLKQLEGFKYVPCRERLCRSLKRLAKNKRDTRLLWACVLDRVDGKYESVTSTVIASVWQELVAMRRVSGLAEGAAGADDDDYEGGATDVVEGEERWMRPKGWEDEEEEEDDEDDEDNLMLLMHENGPNAGPAMGAEEMDEFGEDDDPEDGTYGVPPSSHASGGSRKRARGEKGMPTHSRSARSSYSKLDAVVAAASTAAEQDAASYALAQMLSHNNHLGPAAEDETSTIPTERPIEWKYATNSSQSISTPQEDAYHLLSPDSPLPTSSSNSSQQQIQTDPIPLASLQSISDALADLEKRNYTLQPFIDGSWYEGSSRYWRVVPLNNNSSSSPLREAVVLTEDPPAPVAAPPAKALKRAGGSRLGSKRFHEDDLSAAPQLRRSYSVSSVRQGGSNKMLAALSSVVAAASMDGYKVDSTEPKTGNKRPRSAGSRRGSVGSLGLDSLSGLTVLTTHPAQKAGSGPLSAPAAPEGGMLEGLLPWRHFAPEELEAAAVLGGCAGRGLVFNAGNASTTSNNNNASTSSQQQQGDASVPCTSTGFSSLTPAPSQEFPQSTNLTSTSLPSPSVINVLPPPQRNAMSIHSLTEDLNPPTTTTVTSDTQLLKSHFANPLEGEDRKVLEGRGRHLEYVSVLPTGADGKKGVMLGAEEMKVLHDVGGLSGLINEEGVSGVFAAAAEAAEGGYIHHSSSQMQQM
ncbi:hypothetical protein HDV05_008130 [Chytridiales sp. JEL 0842]|nr:hypothetical protein HDV05_008130 [Chytridiales sp. JEL 0842]